MIRVWDFDTAKEIASIDIGDDHRQKHHFCYFWGEEDQYVLLLNAEQRVQGDPMNVSM